MNDLISVARNLKNNRSAMYANLARGFRDAVRLGLVTFPRRKKAA